jgi:hypothetical protein
MRNDDSAVMTLHSVPAEGAEKSKNTPHYHFIHSMILPSTIKLKRELKSRKFTVRECLFMQRSALRCKQAQSFWIEKEFSPFFVLLDKLIFVPFVCSMSCFVMGYNAISMILCNRCNIKIFGIVV